MRVAVISDIHSNYEAFKAVVDDAQKEKVEAFIFLGDYVSDLAEPIKTLDLLYEIKDKYLTYCLKGNRERYMLEYDADRSGLSYGSQTGSLLYTYQQLRAQDLAFFQSLKIYDVVEIAGVKLEIAHAAKDDDRYLFNDRSAKIDKIFQQMTTSYYLTGHCHKQYHKTHLGKTIINPGSSGLPQDQNWLAKYALLDIEDGKLNFSLKAVTYDLLRTVHAQFASGLVDCARYWAIGALYDVITGEDWVVKLLEKVCATHEEADETAWAKEAEKLGMKFSEAEIIELATITMQDNNH
ncbi:MAG: metallophosphoesterase family protein [Erysipelotrichaceae bacterium]|nr:metallophosphoesterase family protein [Erysipelotrichaceae bacterium]MDY5252527.1 metallophosphoesterase family protein [Erysipelotrichaceae bacterium]